VTIASKNATWFKHSSPPPQAWLSKSGWWTDSSGAIEGNQKNGLDGWTFLVEGHAADIGIGAL